MRHSNSAPDHPASGRGRVELVDLEKFHGDLRVLNGIDPTIESGEFFSLLGPSGCGKTTTLRLIGGFEAIDHGSVLIDGVDMRAVLQELRQGRGQVAGHPSSRPRAPGGVRKSPPASAV